ncbi:hypothetical protein Tco_0700487 [Tanacetum coccineum]
MSDSEDSTVTCTEVSSPFEDMSDIGSLGVDGLPMMLEDPYVEAAHQASPSPNYVPGPEHPPSPVYVPYVLEPVYPKFMPPKDDVLSAEEQPLPAALLPTADSPGYITKSYPEEDSEEDDEDHEEDLADYPTDRDDDDDEEESSRDDVDDEEEDEDEDEEEDEEHPAQTNFVLSPVHRVTARMSIRAQTPISLPSDIEILSPPLPVSPLPLPASPTYPLRYRAAMIRLRAESLSTSHLLLLPSPSVLPHTKASSSVFEVTLPPQKRLYIALGLRFEVGKSSSAPTARPTRGFRADYGFVGTLDDEIRRDPEREDTDEIYGRLDDTQDDRSLMSGQLNMLRRDRRAHARTARLITSDQDRGVAGSRPQETDTTHRGTDTDEDTADINDSTPESAGTR